jgi:predicted O-methyltransferase YrrM
MFFDLAPWKKLLLISLALFFIFVSALGWELTHQSILFLTLAILFGLLLLAQTIYYLELQRWLHQPNENYRQIESLFFLYSALKPRHPLPPMRDWAISPDFANLVISLVRECRPKVVLELGSGVSTLITAYILEENQEGVVISLDHDPRFAATTAAALARHGLQARATVIPAPLNPTSIHGKSYRWYTLDKPGDLDAIDLLIVDGPPVTTQKLARYPALPVLFPRLSANAVILVDDAQRADETRMVNLWLQEFGCFTREYVTAEKGAVILRRTSQQ